MFATPVAGGEVAGDCELDGEEVGLAVFRAGQLTSPIAEITARKMEKHPVKSGCGFFMLSR
jgi:hypothetical protein